MPTPPAEDIEWASITDKGEVIITVAQTWKQANTNAYPLAWPDRVVSTKPVKARG